MLSHSSAEEKKERKKSASRLDLFRVDRLVRGTLRKRLRGMSGGASFSQKALAHLERKATRKCLLICVPGAQRPTKDHVAGCKHTTVSRGFVIPRVFSLAVRPFVARNKHDSVVRSRVNICVQIAVRLPEGHCEEHLLQRGRASAANPAHARGSSDHRGLEPSSRLEPKFFLFFRRQISVSYGSDL